MSAPLEALTTNPYPVTVTAGFDGNNQPYFLYTGPDGQSMRSPLIIPSAQTPYDSITFRQAPDTSELRLWAAVTHTLDNSSKVPQGDNLLLAREGAVTITVKLGTWRGTVLVFEQLDADGVVTALVPTPDPTSENRG
ncbi:MAG: hypothetical protein EKK52_09030 [Burkholderiales bacterium]|uniref:hypothetical protein n=1 Tax=Roseateles sp. TaxID=1971397 RepID=UPI000F9F6DE7|nr:MAG: hypothetical protein EKK52_09030 [Burkholderiales bacterium]